MKRQVITSQFSGSYLNKLWTRRFILGSVLQRYDPVKANTGVSVDEEIVDKALLRAQRVLSQAWELPVKMMDSISERRIFTVLSKYALCEGLLSEEALEELEKTVALLPGAPTQLVDPRKMESLLYAMGYLEIGDNLHRISFRGQLDYSPEANSLMTSFLSEKRQKVGGDVYDSIRVSCDGPGYAIDSATTSEVDDAIGVEVSPTGEEWFTVYVSDATVYCPYDSSLEQVTARALGTTTYLPEGVFFMLPKPIVEAATLREDKPCRTFNIRFQIDASGEIKNYSVEVGWLQQLRRLTYEHMQHIVGEEQDAAPTEDSGIKTSCSVAAPSWMKEKDIVSLQRIYRAAKLRFEARMKSSMGMGFTPIDSGLPDPYIKVENTEVISVQDQILSTQEARLAVAELMIAANEVCSRLAQANGIPIPFRGTRILSNNHEAAQYFEEPQGVTKMDSLDTSRKFMAEAMQETIRRLSAVTRAMYHHAPLYHAGLLTSHYTHSTSPLRRYPDMLVHHQLKVWLFHQKRRITPKAGAVPFLEQYIPEYTLASLCTSISMKQEHSALLQDKSNRYWVLRYMEKLVRSALPNKKTFLCFVGETKHVAKSAEYSRFRSSFEETVAAISGATADASHFSSRYLQKVPQFTYVSQIYIPEVQLTHTIHHSCEGVKVGAVIECAIACICPTQSVLEMQLLAVKNEGDEIFFNRILRGGIISHIDA